MLLTFIASVIVLIMFLFVSGTSKQIADWSGNLGDAVSSVTNIWNAPAPNPPGNYNLRGAPSLNAAQADEILAAYGSPAHGTGRAWVEFGKRYNIDPAFALAFFIHESGAGTNPNWAGLKADGSTTHNVGNIICAGYPTCYGRFRDYNSWATGIEDWYRLIDVEYIEGRGTNTVAEIIPIYAPAFENDVNGYVRAVEQLVDGWRLQYGEYGDQNLYARLEVPASAQPRGNPLNAINTVMTQDYGVGTHAPANVWGAIDLALDGNGDGTADPEGTQGHPVYATHDGLVKVSANSYPAGNHVWVINEHYKTGYAHLQAFAVSEGQTVRRGDVIGYIGSTGQSSGPHLDYQVWTWQGNAWVNVNPQEYYVFERMQ
jgi:murein DD-endopeptidase MepM/ murein hydrolase activator NlpD